LSRSCTKHLKTKLKNSIKYHDLHALLPQIPRSNSFLYKGSGYVIRRDNKEGIAWSDGEHEGATRRGWAKLGIGFLGGSEA
jgi:hypothetical protein